MSTPCLEVSFWLPIWGHAFVNSICVFLVCVLEPEFWACFGGQNWTIGPQMELAASAAFRIVLAVKQHTHAHCVRTAWCVPMPLSLLRAASVGASPSGPSCSYPGPSSNASCWRRSCTDYGETLGSGRGILYCRISIASLFEFRTYEVITNTLPELVHGGCVGDRRDGHCAPTSELPTVLLATIAPAWCCVLSPVPTSDQPSAQSAQAAKNDQEFSLNLPYLLESYRLLYFPHT